MANFYNLVFYLDANGKEHVHKVKAGFDGLLSTFIQSTLNYLHSAPFISPHTTDDVKLRILWWGNEDWESDQNYKIGDTLEGCTLVLVDEHLANHGVEHFNLLSGCLLQQEGLTPKHPNRSPPKEVLSLKPSFWGIGIDLKALWKNLQQRWHRGQG